MKSDKLRILWMVSVDADNTNAQSLNSREIALRLDATEFVSTFFYEREPDARLLQLPQIRLMRLPKKRRSGAVLKEMLSGQQLITYMDYSPASYLFVHLPKGLRRGTRTVVHVEAPAGQVQGAPRALRFLHDAIVPRCDVHTAITEFVAREMERRGLKPSAVLPVGVDTRQFVPPAVPRNGNPVTVLFVGTVMARKGVLTLLDLAREIPHARFLVLGAARDGFDRIVATKIQQLGISNVRLLGPQPQKVVLETMQASDIFLLPSRLEGMPRVTLEAAATGLPCVVFDSYQTPSVVNGRTGFQVSTNEEMVRCVSLLASDRALRHKMGAAAREHARQFDWDIVAVRWQQEYRRIAGNVLGFARRATAVA